MIQTTITIIITELIFFKSSFHTTVIILFETNTKYQCSIVIHKIYKLTLSVKVNINLLSQTKLVGKSVKTLLNQTRR